MKVLSKIIIGSLLFLEPVKAMNEEETSNLQSTQSIQLHSTKTQSSSLTTSFESLPNVLVGSIFKFLDVNDLGRTAQVSTRWKKIEESSNLWRYIGLSYYGDFLSEEDLKENPKQKVVYHCLSAVVNATKDLKSIERLINHYQLNLYVPPFKEYIESIVDSIIMNYSCSSSFPYEEFIAQDNYNSEIIEKKIKDLYKIGSYMENYNIDSRYKIAKKLNDLLVERGNPKAIERKIKGLSSKSIRIELFAGWSHIGTQYRSVPRYGYNENPLAAKELNDLLIEKEISHTTQRKISARSFSTESSYEKDLFCFKEPIELLVKKGDLQAIRRKIEDHLKGEYGYEKKPVAAREFIESLVICEFPIARAIGKYIKAFALKYGVAQLGYEKDREKAFKFIKEHHVPY